MRGPGCYPIADWDGLRPAVLVFLSCLMHIIRRRVWGHQLDGQLGLTPFEKCTSVSISYWQYVCLTQEWVTII